MNLSVFFFFLFLKLFVVVFISFILWSIPRGRNSTIKLFLFCSLLSGGTGVIEVSWYWSRRYLRGWQCVGNPAHEPEDCRVAQFIRTSPPGVVEYTAGILGISVSLDRSPHLRPANWLECPGRIQTRAPSPGSLEIRELWSQCGLVAVESMCKAPV